MNVHWIANPPAAPIDQSHLGLFVDAAGALTRLGGDPNVMVYAVVAVDPELGIGTLPMHTLTARRACQPERDPIASDYP